MSERESLLAGINLFDTMLKGIAYDQSEESRVMKCKVLGGMIESTLTPAPDSEAERLLREVALWTYRIGSAHPKNVLQEALAWRDRIDAHLARQPAAQSERMRPRSDTVGVTGVRGEFVLGPIPERREGERRNGDLPHWYDDLYWRGDASNPVWVNNQRKADRRQPAAREPEGQKVPQLICPKCGANRAEESCKQPDLLMCAYLGTAA